MDTLFLIPARGGSKGVPGKNIKLLNGKPLITYTIDMARRLSTDENICVSSDCNDIISAVQAYGLEVPFKRPHDLSQDHSGSYDVILHALNHYVSKGKDFRRVMLLQPTSPFRQLEHLKEMQTLFSSEIDMVVSVSRSHMNPYFNLFEEDSSGFLYKSKEGGYQSRQELPSVYAYNGSAYLINVQSLRTMPLHKFTKIRKYLMDDIHSLDIDTPLDWAICETVIKEGFYKNENS